MDPVGNLISILAVLGVGVLARAVFESGRPGLFALGRPRFDPSREFKSVAARLGLDTKGGAALSGRMAALGVDVEVEARATPEGHVDWKYDYRAAAYFDRALRLGLSVVLAEQRASGKKAYRVVSKVFDRRFSVQARDALLAGSLFRGDPEERMLALAAQGLEIDVNDVRVALRAQRQLGADELEWFVLRSAELAHAIAGARARMAAVETKIADWPGIANALAATWDGSQRILALDVELGQVRTLVSPDGLDVVVTLVLARAFASELRVVSAAAVSAWDRWVGQDVRVGDPGFDDAFVVRARDAEDAKSRLNAEVRAGIVTLSAYADRITIERSRLVVSLAHTGPTAAEFRVVLDRMEDVVRGLSGRRRAAYR